MRTVTVAQRRRAVVRRHHLGGDAAGPEAVTDALLALHATDPASVYLSVLARSHGTTLADISAAMYERRSLVRWMAMRRTLFVFDRTDIPMIQAAVSDPLAATLRRQLVSRLQRTGTEPPIEGDVGDWLTDLGDRVDDALLARGSATGAQLSTDVPALRTVVSPQDQPQNLTSPFLTLLSAQGRMVRSTPAGTWTTRHHRWEPVGLWWPAGLPQLPAQEAQTELARRWLARFGPATFEDLQWWTGWTKTTLRAALGALPVEEVDLHGEPGIALGVPEDDGAGAPPVVTLLPALDPTPMGWKRREWFFAVPQAQVMDRNGNIGPTVWADGEIVGTWGTTPTGEIRTRVVADRGAEVAAAVEAAAAQLAGRIDGAVINPAFPTPLERALVRG